MTNPQLIYPVVNNEICPSYDWEQVKDVPAAIFIQQILEILTKTITPEEEIKRVHFERQK